VAVTVAVIGDIIRDVVARPRGPIQSDTDTPSDIDIYVGGSAANTATWLGVLGVPVSFTGRVAGEDVAALSDHLKHHSVIPFLQEDPDHPTGTIVVIVEGETRTMLTERGANSLLDVSTVSPDAVAGARILHLTGYSFFHAQHPQPLIDLIDRVRSGGTLVSVDCSSTAFLEDFGIDAWWEMLEHVDIVRGNADEAALITGQRDPIEACQAIASRGHLAVITRGGDGAVWCEPDGAPQPLPAAPLGPAGYVDPVGAGDSFSAGFLAGLSRGNSVREAVSEGLTLSARVVSQPGAGPS